MIRFILSRLLQAIVVIYVIATVVFFMMKAVPGGPFSQERNVSPYILEKIQEQYGLNDPLFAQYKNFMWDLTPKKLNLTKLLTFDLKGGLGIDFGYSFRYEGRTVNQLIKESFPVSLELGLYALLLASTIGITAGTIAALNQNRFWDYFPMSLTMAGICIPSFVVAPILVLIFGFWVPEAIRLPILFWEPPYEAGFFERASYKILPAVTLAFYYTASLSRLTRGSMLEVMNQDFIRTARAKGLSERAVVVKHGLRAGMIPVISYLGPVAAHLITGSFIVETIFMLPGLGRHLINAALNRDYTLIMGTVLLYATLLILLNLAVDVVLALLNPKEKLSLKNS
ncbi:MAG: ABC transporter permease subunit [Opitutales bacterium]|nr:ABC transporter permease subunit [Opitutales bacterium]